MRFFTSDLHLGHKNISALSGRPFDTVEEMNETLVTNWNNLVRFDDTVWVLGDFAMGTIADTLPLAHYLNGTKILVAGNHDRCWNHHGPKHEKWIQTYLEAGFHYVHQGQVQLNLGGTPVELCHFPYTGDHTETDRYVDARPVDVGFWLLHGHVHNLWRQRGRQINVGVDAWNFHPVAEYQIVGLITNGPNDKEPIS